MEQNIQINEIRTPDALRPYLTDLYIGMVDFIKRSKSTGDIAAYYNYIMSNFGKPHFGLFVATDTETNEFIGFCILNVEQVKLHEFLCEVKVTYIKPGRYKKLWDDGFHIVEQWAKEHKCTRLRNYSMRNPKAFYKRIKHLGFKPIGVIFEKDLGGELYA